MRALEWCRPRSPWTGRTCLGITSLWWPRRLVGTRIICTHSHLCPFVSTRVGQQSSLTLSAHLLQVSVLTLLQCFFLESENSVSVEFWFDTGSQHDEMVFHKSDGFRSKPVDELQSFDQVSIHFLSLIYFYFNLRTSSNLHWRRISIFLYLIQSHLGPVSCSRPALMKTTFMWWSFWQTSQSILFPHQ